jgi:hypothetical protein
MKEIVAVCENLTFNLSNHENYLAIIIINFIIKMIYVLKHITQIIIKGK